MTRTPTISPRLECDPGSLAGDSEGMAGTERRSEEAEMPNPFQDARHGTPMRCAARSVTDRLVSSGITPGAPHFAQKSASNGSRSVAMRAESGCADFGPPRAKGLNPVRLALKPVGLSCSAKFDQTTATQPKQPSSKSSKKSCKTCRQGHRQLAYILREVKGS